MSTRRTFGHGRPKSYKPTPEQAKANEVLRRRYAEVSIFAGFSALLNGETEEFVVYDRGLQADLREAGDAESGPLAINKRNLFPSLDRFLIALKNPDIIPDAADTIERRILYTGPVGPASDTIQPTH